MFRNRGWGRPRPWDWRRRPSFGGSLIGGIIGGAASEIGANIVDAAMGRGGSQEALPEPPSPVLAAAPPVAPVIVNVTVAANTATPVATPVANTP